MKKYGTFLIVFILASYSFIGQAQPGKGQTTPAGKGSRKAAVTLKRISAGEINPAAKNSFAVDFPNTPAIKWERSAYFDEVVFSKDGKQYRGFYDPDGTLVGTTTVVSFSDLPASAQKEIQKKYKDYTIGKVIFYDDNQASSTDMYLYGQQFEDQDNYFVEAVKGTKKIILQATPEGEVLFFTDF
jgi:hypothetical protein